MANTDGDTIVRFVHGGHTDGAAAFRLVTRRWRLVLACALAGAAAAAGLCQLLPTRYASAAILMLDPLSQQRSGTNISSSSLLPPSEEMVRKNEMALIRSRQLAEQVIEDLDLEQDPEFNQTLRPPSAMKIALRHAQQVVNQGIGLLGLFNGPAAQPVAGSERALVVDEFLRRLDVTSTDASRIIELRFSSSSPAKAARIAQAITNQAILWTASHFATQAKATSQSLEADIAALNLKIRDAEQKIETIRREHGSLPAADLQVLTQNIFNLNIQIGNASGERAASEARLAQLQAARAAGRVDTLPAVLASLLVQRLQAEAAQLSAKVDGQAALYEGTSGKTIEVRAALQSLRAQIGLEVARIAASYESDAAMAMAKEAALLGMLGRLKDQMAKARTAEVDVRMYEREADVSRTLLNRLVAQLTTEQAQMDRSPPGGQIISDATVPRAPSFPPTMPLIGAGFILFATAGSGLAVLLERRDDAIRSTAQLRDITTAKVLGAIPATGKPLTRRRPPPAVLVLTEPVSMFVDSLRAVWLRLEHVIPQAAKTILITSSVAGEGKSAIAVSLARMLAASGRSIAIIDADLRAPKVHGMLGLRRSPGLANLLEGDGTLDDALQRDEASSAFVVAAGTTLRSPVELLGSPAMVQLLNDLAARFSFVIIDSPPVLAVPDTGVLALLADATVMAVRWGNTRGVTFSLALQHLQDLDVSVQGLVLTMVDPRQYAQCGYVTDEISSGTRLVYYAA
jgi:capsular exopolysaccharide synthesis family protein